ncbi:hypothetical protein L207DRAFT_552359 [Hyaloscypha variabilis F]|uniref:Zn(2)-C6 fungal-type domain-containing protein n=1 Tax=Hyaloscypha variabilis (strain UAMH 11265 / GT02V1 / F) TaxID=1149755 RepID=A0A2J6RZH2_HYAVF|nr:hypothetical protein L207DRAFT_552359 [Hyaloscypha variabilis F]
MVFHGRPSKACAECRQRRTRCDLSKPSCSQCIRAKRTCPGYREGLIIHDESQTLSTKYSGGSEQNKSPRSSRNSSVFSDDESTSSIARSYDDSRLERDIEPQAGFYPLTSPPGISAEDQATTFFFGNYVSSRNMLNTCGNYQYLPTIYSNQPVGTALRQVIAAIGLAGLANFWKAPNIMAQANRAYSIALQTVNVSLGKIEEAKSDQTVVTIMLLAQYENNTTNGTRSMKAWTEHILGATALMKLRGKNSLSNPLGRNIFVHLRQGLISSCVQRHCAVPKSIVELAKYSLQFETPVEAASTRLGLIISEYTVIRTSMEHIKGLDDSRKIVAALWELDIKYLDWAQNLPPEFVITQVPVPAAARGKEVWGQHYNKYTSIFITSIWNNYNCARALCNELLRHQVSSLLHWSGPLDPHEIETEQGPVTFETILPITISTISALANDIFASVPFFLSDSQQEAPRVLAGNLVLWPLYLAAQTSTATVEIQRWAAGRLRYIAETMGIRQAAPPYAGFAREAQLVDSVAGEAMVEAM